MKGHIRKRGRSSWAVVLDLGRDADGKRRQKWHSVRGTRKDAQRELARLLNQINTGAYIEQGSTQRSSVSASVIRPLALRSTRIPMSYPACSKMP